MQITHILGVLGVAVSLTFGVWGVILMLRRRYPGEITFVREGCIGLFEAIVRNLPGLSVLYEGKAVSEGLVLLKASFLNSGAKDVSPAMVEEKLTLSLPESYRWLTAKIVRTSQKVRASIHTSERQLVVDTGLFRCGEYIRFEALAEVPIDKGKAGNSSRNIAEDFWRALEATHRIADTQRIRATTLPSFSTTPVTAKILAAVFFIVAALQAWFFSKDMLHLRGWLLTAYGFILFVPMVALLCAALPRWWVEYWRERSRKRLIKLLSLSEKTRLKTQAEVREVSSEAAPSAVPGEPLT